MFQKKTLPLHMVSVSVPTDTTPSFCSCSYSIALLFYNLIYDFLQLRGSIVIISPPMG